MSPSLGSTFGNMYVILIHVSIGNVIDIFLQAFYLQASSYFEFYN